MGLLAGTMQQGYYEGSPINHASNLEGKLMIMHGKQQMIMSIISVLKCWWSKLIAYNKLFSMMSSIPCGRMG